MSDQKNFYVTTPIYYGNGVPHVGHFYTSTIANIIHLYHKISWCESRFTTGIDENSQKAVIEAEKGWLDIMDYLDEMAYKHREVWDHFAFDYTDFIRTTEQRHHKVVQDVLQHCFDKWDIYQWEYEGMYCIGCEAFKKDDDLVFLNRSSWETFPITPKVVPSENIIKVCPDHLKTPDTIKETNYFFKLSKYQTWIEEFYSAHPEFVIPDFRFNEVRAFVERWLEDFSISRETNTFGIALPFDNSQVTYVWFDALFNYYTSCKYSRWGNRDNTQFSDESDLWPANLQIVWKDIIRFHAIFWPAMLASYFDLGEQGSDGIVHFKASDSKKLPKQILTGWFFTVDGQKISKSLGNVIEPVEYSKEYSKELLTLYILSAFPIGNDGDYDRKDAVLTYNAKLANNLGNLVNRVVVLSLKWKSEWLSCEKDRSKYLITDNEIEKIQNYYISYNLKWVLDLCFENLDGLNKYADENEPWKLIQTDTKKAEEVLYALAEWLRQIGLLLYPFFPEKMSEMFEKLWLTWYGKDLELGKLEELIEKKEVFQIKEKWEALFQRVDIK